MPQSVSCSLCVSCYARPIRLRSLTLFLRCYMTGLKRIVESRKCSVLYSELNRGSVFRGTRKTKQNQDCTSIDVQLPRAYQEHCLGQCALPLVSLGDILAHCSRLVVSVWKCFSRIRALKKTFTKLKLFCNSVLYSAPHYLSQRHRTPNPRPYS